MAIFLTENADGNLELSGTSLFWRLAMDDFGFCKVPETDAECHQLMVALYDFANMENDATQGETALFQKKLEAIQILDGLIDGEDDELSRQLNIVKEALLFAPS